MCNHKILGNTVHSVVVRAACMIFLLTDKENDPRRFPVLTLLPSLSYPPHYLTLLPHYLPCLPHYTTLPPSLSYPASLIIIPCLPHFPSPPHYPTPPP